MLATNSSGRAVANTIGLIGVTLLLALVAFLFFNKNFVSDQFAVWAYTPTDEVQALTNQVQFSDKGTFYFYKTHPEIASASQFNEGCPRQEPSNPILGCYTGDRIYIYDVTNEQLKGIEEVTAAHEMLHSAWDRLSTSEKDRLTVLLKNEYAKHATGELAERIAYYERNEPGQLANELHSILPTEIDVLSPELESYYQDYFKDRKKIVAFHATYSSVLSALNTQIESYYMELLSLGASIESASTVYESQAASLSDAIARFNAKAANNEFASQQQFVTERAALVSQSLQVQASRDAINNDITRYNTTYSEYQQVAGELDTLHKSLDSISALPQTPSIEE